MFDTLKILNHKCHIMSNGVSADSIFAFLDNADKSESRRKIPTAAELREKTQQKEKKLERLIQNTKQEINELTLMKNKISEQREEYRFMLMKIQASMDRVIHEKENFTKKIEDLSFQLSEISRTQNNDSTKERIDAQIKKAVNDSIQSMKLKLSAKIRVITEEAARKAQWEFAPHFSQLKSDHNTEINQIKSQHNKEIELIMQTAREQLNENLSSIRQQFYDQTEKQINIIEKQNSKSTESLRKKNERERLRYEKDINSIYKSIESEVSEIKSWYQKEYDRERSKTTRLMDECRNDIFLAKKRAESQIQHFNIIEQKNEAFFAQLTEAEFDLSFEDSNKSYIMNKRKEIENELNEFKEHLFFETENNINSKLTELQRNISSLISEIDFLGKEKERVSNLREKEVNFRQRQEKRTLSSRKEINIVNETMSKLKDQLFAINNETLNAKSNIVDVSKHSEICSQIREETNLLRIEKKKMEQIHLSEINFTKENHQKAITVTSAKVKSIIAQKDSQIAQLNQQILAEKEKIDALADALHS